MKELKALLKVKTIITLLVFGVFAYLSIVGKIEAKDFMLILGMVATYYFNKDNKDSKETSTVEKTEEKIN
jgi:hypothetical protein